MNKPGILNSYEICRLEEVSEKCKKFKGNYNLMQISKEKYFQNTNKDTMATTKKP